MSASDIEHRLDEALVELGRLRAENERLRKLLALGQQQRAVAAAIDSARHRQDPPPAAAAKIALFRSLFRGREDVYARRWENARTGKSGYVPATVGGWTSDGPKTYLPLTDEAIEQHLRGRESIGLYPLLTDDSCWFLACDFDGGTWELDALALLAACRDRDVSAVLERSRSGAGGHVWIFFSERVAAGAARRLGALLLRDAMTRRAEVDLASYDRLFPSQDFLPHRGFGNLIALPLQGRCRAAGTSVFLDPGTLEPWPDQWAFLASVARVSPADLERLLADGDVVVGPEVLGVRKREADDERVPAEVRCTVGADIAIARSQLPPSLLARLKHLASLHNPLFYERQRLRLSTHQTPRLIRCYEEDLTQLRLPRGLLDQVEEAIAKAGGRLIVADRRPDHERVPLEFHGELTPLQAAAVEAILAHESGLLVAPPGSGKTVMACALIAERKLPTLILANSKPLLEQWRTQLQTLLGLPSKQIGQRGGGRRKLTGVIDLAMIQSLKAIDDLETFFSPYGLLVVDECHHLPAFSFEAAVRRAPARHFLGLTATPYRRDGLQQIVTMQCGPIRHQIAASEGPSGTIDRCLTVRETSFTPANAAAAPIQELFRLLVENMERNERICDDVEHAVAGGRRCLVLSQWKEHCALLAQILRDRGITPILLEGGLGARERRRRLDQIDQTPTDAPLVVLATGQYLGEGFDCPQLDTLFLAFPVSFKGRLVQYTGRLLRQHENKTQVRVYDYADTRMPVLRAMHSRRLATYMTLGFTPDQPATAERTLTLPILDTRPWIDLPK